MGIGKTTMAITTHHVQHIVNLIRVDIEANPRLYIWLVDDLDAGCPSNPAMLAKHGRDCLYAKTSLTY